MFTVPPLMTDYALESTGDSGRWRALLASTPQLKTEKSGFAWLKQPSLRPKSQTQLQIQRECRKCFLFAIWCFRLILRIGTNTENPMYVCHPTPQATSKLCFSRRSLNIG